jgi:hypothetical protein
MSVVTQRRGFMKKLFIVFVLLFFTQFVFGQNRQNELYGGQWEHRPPNGHPTYLFFNEEGVNVFWNGDTWGVFALHPYAYVNNILTIRQVGSQQNILLNCWMFVSGNHLVLLFDDGWMLFEKNTSFDSRSFLEERRKFFNSQ